MSRGQSHLAQQPGDRSDAQTFHRVLVVRQPHDLRFGGVDLVERRRISGLSNVAIAIGRAAQNRDFPGFGAMALAAPGSFEDLRTLIFGDHALELQHQLIFRRAGMRRLEENRLDAVAGELLGQQDLVGVFAAQPVRRVDQDSLNVALGGEIAQPLQTRPQQAGAAEPLVLDDPLISDAVSLFPRELDAAPPSGSRSCSPPSAARRRLSRRSQRPSSLSPLTRGSAPTARTRSGTRIS